MSQFRNLEQLKSSRLIQRLLRNFLEFHLEFLGGLHTREGFQPPTELLVATRVIRKSPEC